MNGLYVLKLSVSDGDVSSEDTVQIIATTPNVPPNANAGDDITIYLGERAVLDGSASKDPDSWPQPLSYSWNFVALPNGSQLNRSNISETHAVSPLFTPDVEGTYVLELMVSDGPDAAFDNVAVTAVKPHSLYSKGAYIFIKPKLGVSCSSDLINFPLLIEIANDAQLRHKTYGGWVENINGYDIIFEDANHNQLAHQLEYYDGSTGSLIVWVKIPTLLISTSTVITVEYGNPGISQPTENQIAVWDSHYKAVYHLNQRPRNDLKIYDSTINALDLTPQSSIFDSNRVEAQVGYGLKFRGWDYLISSKNLSLSNRGKFTIETWVKSSSYWGGRQAMVSVQDGNTHGSRTLTSYDDGPMGVQFYYDVPPPTYQIGNPQAHNTWVHLVARYDGTKLEGFMNGVKTSYTSYPGWGPVTGVVTLGVWRGETGWLNWFLTEGYLDEVRISDDARDSCWIETSYNNQRAPFSFYTIGSNPLPR